MDQYCNYCKLTQHKTKFIRIIRRRNYNIDSDTVEMLYMLFNYGVNPDLFNRYLIALKDPTGTQIMINDTEREFAHEIIEILECNCKS